MTARFATLADRAQIKALWLCCFSQDDPIDVDGFLDRFLFNQSALVLAEDGMITSMLFLLPIAIRIGDRRLEAGYIYAGATHPHYRGVGRYRALLSFAESVARKRGYAALLLRPADRALENSYRRLGFTRSMRVAVTKACLDDGAADLNPQLVSAASYAAARNRLLAQTKEPFVEWDEQALDYALSFCTGLVFQNACAIVSSAEGMTCIWELICKPSEKAGILRAVLKRFPCEHFFARSPIERGDPHNAETIGLYKPLSEEAERLLFEKNLYFGYPLE